MGGDPTDLASEFGAVIQEIVLPLGILRRAKSSWGANGDTVVNGPGLHHCHECVSTLLSVHGEALVIRCVGLSKAEEEVLGSCCDRFLGVGCPWVRCFVWFAHVGELVVALRNKLKFAAKVSWRT